MKRKIDLQKLEDKARIAELVSKLTWLKVPEAAVYANMSESKLWALITDKLIPSSKDQGAVVIHRQDIDKYYKLRQRSLVNPSSQSEP